jgi:hypothetical protein
MKAAPAAIVFAVVSLFMWTLTTHGKFSVSGDEPHYLMISESLRTDGDFDLSNNYAQNDGRLFGHQDLQVELHAARARNGELRSVHGVGLPVLVLPVYAAAQLVVRLIPEETLSRFRTSRGLLVYSIISVSLIALTAFGMALLCDGLSRICGARMAAVIAIAVGISPPVLSHGFLIFPEVIALFVSCWVIWFITKSPWPSDARHSVGLALGLGLLPWFHLKFMPFAAALSLVVYWRRPESFREASASHQWLRPLLFCAPQLLAIVWLYREWGSPGGAFSSGVLGTGAMPLSAASLLHGAIGLLFDRQSGLLAFAPLYWIIPACILLTWRASRDMLLPAAMLYLPAAAFEIGWWAGFSPAARYLVPAIPLFAIPFALAATNRAVRIVGVMLMLAQCVFNALVWQNPRWLWPREDGNRLLAALSVPGEWYSGMLAPVRDQGLTAASLLPLTVAVVVTWSVVRAAKRAAVSPRTF